MGGLSCENLSEVGALDAAKRTRQHAGAAYVRLFASSGAFVCVVLSVSLPARQGPESQTPLKFQLRNFERLRGILLDTDTSPFHILQARPCDTGLHMLSAVLVRAQRLALLQIGSYDSLPVSARSTLKKACLE